MSLARRWMVALVLVALACGKRGDPHPPVPVIPKATSDLVVTQRGSKVILSWSYPSVTTAGRTLGPIRRVLVYRYDEPLPVPTPAPDAKTTPTTEPAAAQTSGTASATGPIASFSKIPTLGPLQFNKLKQKVDALEGPSLPAASVGAKLVFEDTPPVRTADQRPVRLTYAVVTEGASATSELSNLATIVPLDVPTAPANLTATAEPEGVVLHWDVPQKSVTGADKPPIAGYNVYRTTAGQSFDQFTTPVNPAPVKDANFTDVPPYGKYDYRVSALAATGAPRLESEMSTPTTVEFKDLTPPPVPANLTVLVETNAVRLVWDPVDAPDLNGYNVYRVQGPYRLRLTGPPARQTNFRDISVEKGVTYTYEVTAEDWSKNESKPVVSAPVLVPKAQ